MNLNDIGCTQMSALFANYLCCTANQVAIFHWYTDFPFFLCVLHGVVESY